MTETDRRTELQLLAGRIREYDAVDDAFLAKSFTDRHLFVDVHGDERLPDAVAERLSEYDLYGANQVYEDDHANCSFAGDVPGGTRHQFVDVRTRGDHQSYVVD